MSRTDLPFVIHYNPITSIDQRDLDFLIPADYGTYIDTDIKLKGRLTKAGGSTPDQSLREMQNVRLNVPYRGKGS